MVAAAAVARVINTEEGALRGIPTIIRLRHSLLSSDLWERRKEKRDEADGGYALETKCRFLLLISILHIALVDLPLMIQSYSNV